MKALPIGSIVVPFCGLYLGSYNVIPKRNYYGAYGIQHQEKEPHLLGSFADALDAPAAKRPRAPGTAGGL